MVSFSCDNCQETVKKPKANQHAGRCRGSLTCIDCSKTFWNGEWSAHNSCISEAEAYQGALYKPTKKELKRKQQQEKQEKQTGVNPIVDSLAVSADKLPKDTAIVEENGKSKSAKKPKTAEAGATESTNAQLSLLDEVVDSTSGPISLHKILKQLKSAGKTDKDAF